MLLLPCLLVAWPLTFAQSSPGPPPSQQPPRLVLTDDAATLDEALASRTPSAELKVQVEGLSLPADEASMVRLLVVAAFDDPQEGVPLASVAFDILDSQGRRQAHALHRVALRRTASGALAFAAFTPVPPGTYRLKLAVMRNGRVGVAEAPVVARVEHAASLRLGDVLVGETPGGDVAAIFSAGRRVRGDRLVVSLPLFVDASLPPDLAITLEVAKSESGPAVLSAPLPLLPGERGPRLGQAVADARVLPAGEYVARVGVAVPGREVVRLASRFVVERAEAGTGPRPVAAAPGAVLDPESTFKLDDVLDPAVVAPFLDELATQGGQKAKPALDQARAGRYVEAAKALPPGGPNDPVHPFLAGLSLLSGRQLQAASDSFRQAQRAFPDSFVATFYVGACYAAGGRDAQAVNVWQTSLIGLEGHPIVFRLLGEAFTRMGQPDRALETLEEASARWPDDARFRLRLAQAALAARHWDRVAAVVDEASARAPAEHELLFTGMRAIFEEASGWSSPPPHAAAVLARLKRYREAYLSAGGPRQPLVDEWLAAVEKKVQQVPGSRPNPSQGPQ